MTRQYRDASNLNVRIALCERLITNIHGLACWVFCELASCGAIHTTNVQGRFIVCK